MTCLAALRTCNRGTPHCSPSWLQFEESLDLREQTHPLEPHLHFTTTVMTALLSEYAVLYDLSRLKNVLPNYETLNSKLKCVQ